MLHFSSQSVWAVYTSITKSRRLSERDTSGFPSFTFITLLGVVKTRIKSLPSRATTYLKLLPSRNERALIISRLSASFIGYFRGGTTAYKRS